MYGEGGHYALHHDAESLSRKYTFLAYLVCPPHIDGNPHNGGIRFPKAGADGEVFECQPGRYLLWRNFYDGGKRLDPRVVHAAMPVVVPRGDGREGGTMVVGGASVHKMAINLWLRDAPNQKRKRG